ncbi:MAG: KEOPS complex subunit Pcc1 [Candidatus Caldarchaeum sp.]
MKLAKVSIEFKIYLPESLALVMVKSVMSEVLTMKEGRSKMDLKVGEDGLIGRIFSEDIVAARAAANTLIRLLDTSYKTMEVVGYVG